MRSVGRKRLKVSAIATSNRPGCRGKVLFKTEEEAKVGLLRYKTDFPFDETVTYYPCPACSFFHLGHQRDNNNEPEIEMMGNFMMHQGLTLAKIKDPSTNGHYWVFAVPEDIEESADAVLDKGILVAYKRFGSDWAEKDQKKSLYFQEFHRCPQLYFKGRLAEFIAKMDFHKANMGDLNTLRMDVLNGLPLTRAAIPEASTRAASTKVDGPTLVRKSPSAQVELYKNQQVFRNSKGRPYLKKQQRCACCDNEIDMVAFIAQDNRSNALTTLHRWLPADDSLSPAGSLEGGRRGDWLCQSCSANHGSVTMAHEPALETAATPEPKAAGLERVSRPALLPEDDQQRKLLRALGAMAANPELSAEFVRGATMMTCLLLGEDAA